MANVSQEVKQEMLTRIKNGEKVADIGKQYGVSTKTIYYWLRSKAESAISVVEHNRIKRENKELKEIIGALTIELELLKKKRA